VNAIAALRNLIVRTKVNRSGDKPQLTWGGGARTTPDVEVMRQQGVYFREPPNAQGVMLAPGGDPSVAVAVGLGGAVPSGAVADGEGGLHYLGTFKVYLHTDGTVRLGDKVATDFVALASLVSTQLGAIKTAFDAHVHTSAAPATPTSPPTVPMPAPGSVAATKVKAL
jgi:hypothetical protein